MRPSFSDTPTAAAGEDYLLFRLDPQLLAPALLCLFRRQARVFSAAVTFGPHVSALSSSIDVRRLRAVRVKA